MRSFTVCIFVIALVGGGLCGRLRRQAPPDAGIMGSPPESMGADMDGPPEGITTQGSVKVDGMNAALAMMLADVEKDKATGVAVDPKKTESILKLASIMGILNKDISEQNKEGIANLMTAPTDVAAPAA